MGRRENEITLLHDEHLQTTLRQTVCERASAKSAADDDDVILSLLPWGAHGPMYRVRRWSGNPTAAVCERAQLELEMSDVESSHWAPTSRALGRSDDCQVMQVRASKRRLAASMAVA